MSYLSRLMRNVERLRPEDRPALLEFQRGVFGSDAAQLDDRHHRWLFEENPCNGKEGPQIWVYRKDGRIVGEQAGMPFELKLGESRVRASWAIDLMVGPEFRQRGIGMVLNEAYVQTNDLTVGIGISDEAYQTFLRAGWLDLGDIPLFVRPLHVGRMFAGRGGTGFRARLAGRVLQPGVRLADAATALVAKRRRAVFERIERFDERVDALWDEASLAYSVIARRDYRVLRWRFDDLPARERYLRFYLREGNVLRGYAVLRVGRRHGADAGIIVDFLSSPRWLSALLARCVGCLREMGAAAVYCAAPHREVGRRLSRLGFLRRASGMHMMARRGGGASTTSDELGEQGDWFVTSADSDADLPREKEGVGS